MATTTITKSSSASVTVQDGQWLTVNGIGTYTFGPGSNAGSVVGIVNSAKIGPFPNAQVVSLCASVTDLVYYTQYQMVPSGSGAPSNFTSSALAEADNGANLICASAQTATVPRGLPVGFGCSFKGVITFNGSATVNDLRTTGAANPWCALVQIGVDTYDVVGGKA